MNRTFCRWVGRANDEIVGKLRFQDMLTVGGRMFHQTHWEPLLRMQGSIAEVKLEIRHADGTTIPMIWNAMREPTADGHIIELAAYVARDRDAYERELVQARKRVEELHAEANVRAAFAEQMMGIVSHDLRNPLSSIAMATMLLAQDELGPKATRLLQNITRSTDRAQSLISDLLDFTQARIGRGLTVVKSEIDVAATIAEAVEELGIIYRGRELLHTREGETILSMGDASRLTQLVGNLVSNAMVHGKPNAPVSVTTRVAPDAFHVSVHNEGEPIPDSVRDALFAPMTRGATASKSGRSVGLGLFIVSEIAKAHGGSVRVDSTLESGTRFSATFPQPHAVKDLA